MIDFVFDLHLRNLKHGHMSNTSRTWHQLQVMQIMVMALNAFPKQKLLIVIYGLCIRKVRRWRPLNLATSIGHHRKIIINQTWEQKDAWEKHGWDGGWCAPLSNFNTRTIFFWPTYSFLTNRLGQSQIDSVKIASLPQYSTLSAHHHHHLECSKLSIFNWSRCRSRTPTIKQSNNAKFQEVKSVLHLQHCLPLSSATQSKITHNWSVICYLPTLIRHLK